jgi:membrane-bound lytic murein transglycosylase MltF
VNVPEGARESINKEAARKNNFLQQRDEIMVEQVKKEYVPVKRNEHVISYVDVMRNYSEDLVRKKKEEEEEAARKKAEEEAAAKAAEEEEKRLEELERQRKAAELAAHN